jgi:hypothetical protein
MSHLINEKNTQMDIIEKVQNMKVCVIHVKKNIENKSGVENTCQSFLIKIRPIIICIIFLSMLDAHIQSHEA